MLRRCERSPRRASSHSGVATFTGPFINYYDAAPMVVSLLVDGALVVLCDREIVESRK